MTMFLNTFKLKVLDSSTFLITVLIIFCDVLNYTYFGVTY